MKKLFLTLMAFAVWSTFFGWKVTLIIMSGLWIHGMGHVLMAHHYGMSTSGIYFIPLIGAVEPIGLKQDHLWQMAMISLAGPVVGMINAAILYGIGVSMDVEIMIAAAGIVAIINLFNLLPLSPLDGGRAMQALLVSSFQKAWVGMIPLGVICFSLLRIIGVSLPMLALLTLMAVMQIKKEIDTQQAEDGGTLPAPRVRMDLAEGLWVMGTYSVLILVLILLIGLCTDSLPILFSS